jgi:EAL domain-containing protein (putative c-di-GMP-specific phosphodiesterase class I)
MSTASSVPFERISRSTLVTEDVWFLSGPTQVGEGVVHSPVDGNPYIVGRKTGVSLKIQFRTVSGNHAMLWVEKGTLFLRDLGSTNGTFINGNRVDQGETIPLSEEDLVHFAEAPFRIRRQSPTGMTNGTIAENVCDQALALVQFDRLMNERLVRPHYQTIVDLNDGRGLGFEVLGRGSVFGLESVGAMFQAAEQLNLEVELSQLLRWEGIRIGRDLPDAPMLFVNTHPREIEDTDGLIQSLVAVRKMTGNTELVLEIHESAVTDMARLQSLMSAMKSLDIRMAYDDFGSGQARLAELIEARPDYVKFDISLIRNIDKADSSRRQMLKTLVKMVCDLEIMSLAEGIETATEAATCRDLGFNLGQGYFFGRPSPA